MADTKALPPEGSNDRASEVYDVASDVVAKSGDVLVTGPGGVVYAMTPNAAADTSDKLLESATTAQGQRMRAEFEKRGRQSG